MIGLALAGRSSPGWLFLKIIYRLCNFILRSNIKRRNIVGCGILRQSGFHRCRFLKGHGAAANSKGFLNDHVADGFEILAS